MSKVRQHNPFMVALAVLGLILGGCCTGQEISQPEAGKEIDLQGMPENQQPIPKEWEGGPPRVALHHETASAARYVGAERIPEQYLRIWIAPYQDLFGSLHEESYIQIVIQGSQWKFPTPTPDEYKVAQ